MSTEIEFLPLSFKPPREGAPEFVKYKVSFKREEMLAFCQANTDEWINGDVKESKSGKVYAARDNWKPEGKRQDAPRQQATSDFRDDDIPF